MKKTRCLWALVTVQALQGIKTGKCLGLVFSAIGFIEIVTHVYFWTYVTIRLGSVH